MSIQKFSFPYYIRTSDSEHSQRFVEVFKNEIDKIPENTVSSRAVMRCLNLDSTNRQYKYNVFQKAYMEFFKEKLIGIS